MIEPQTFLLYAPRGPGIMCALLYFVIHRDIVGWYTGSCDGEFPARYFMLEHYFDPADTRFLVSSQNDVRSAWLWRSESSESPVTGCPVPEAVRHDLDHAQNAFVREWLFYPDDPDAAEDIKAYANRELSVQPVNIRAHKLNKLHTGAALWRYASHNFDSNVLDFIMEYWTLDHRAGLC
ncbi:MAG: hypothetical protein ACKVQU_35400 [Burkholderiales bacterium]